MALNSGYATSALPPGRDVSGLLADVDNDEYWSLSKVKRAYLDYVGSKHEELREARTARSYRHGAQWTEGQVEVFDRRKQPVVTYNRIGRKIDAIVGLMEKLKQDVKGFPLTPSPSDERGAELATAVVRNVVDSELRERNFPAAIEDAAVVGIGGVEMLLERGAKGDIDVGFAKVRSENFFYDYASFEPDFSDARYMGTGKWLDLEDARALSPEKAKSITPGGSELAPDSAQDRHWFNYGSDYKRVRVVEIWYKHRGGWCWCLFTGSTKLREGKGYFYNQKNEQICKFRMFSAFVDHDGDRYGFPRGLKSSQDEINQRRSKGLHELNSRRIKAEDGAFADIEVARREAVRPDGVVIYNKGFEMEFDDQARIANVEGQLKFLEDAKNEIENFGPNPALIGQGLEYKSGRAINLLQQAGIAELGPFVIGIKFWKLEIYRSIWCAATRYWQAERYIRVTGDDGVAQLVQINGVGVDPMTNTPRLINAIGNLDVGFTLDEGPDEVNMMADAYDTLTALATQGAKIPPEILLELSPLHGSVKRKLMAMLNKPDPVTEQAKQIALAGEGAKVDETKSKTALNLAKAQETAQGGAHGIVERQMDAVRANQEHQFKMAESAIKIGADKQKAQTKASMDFANLISNEHKNQQDLRFNAVKTAQELHHGEQKHKQDMELARTKAQSKPKANGSGLPAYAEGGRPTPGFPSLVGEQGPEVFIPDRPGTIIPNGGFGSRWATELQNPAARDRLIAYARAEVGGQGPEAIQAFLETIRNRGIARQQDVSRVLSGDYFPDVTHSRASRPVSDADRAKFGPLVDKVLAGSNITNFATGNASGTVGFAGGPQTAEYGGERYGVEGPDKGWWTKIGAEGPTGGSVGYTGRGVGTGGPGGDSAGYSLASLRSRQEIPSFSPFIDYAARGAFPRIGG